jgi:hypothetical protein
MDSASHDLDIDPGPHLFDAWATAGATGPRAEIFSLNHRWNC